MHQADKNTPKVNPVMDFFRGVLLKGVF